MKLSHFVVGFFQAILLLLVPVNVNWVLIRLVIRILLVDTHSDGFIINFSVNEQTEDR